jgi:hypothetical protein
MITFLVNGRIAQFGVGCIKATAAALGCGAARSMGAD